MGAEPIMQPEETEPITTDLAATEKPAAGQHSEVEVKPEELDLAANLLKERGFENEAKDPAFLHDFARAYFFHAFPSPDNKNPFEGALAYAQNIQTNSRSS